MVFRARYMFQRIVFYLICILSEVFPNQNCVNYISNQHFGQYLNLPAKEAINNIGLQQCVKTCSTREWCSSINYNRENLKCKLLNSTINANPALLVEDTGYVHLDHTNWSPESEGSCGAVICDAAESCVLLKSGSTHCTISKCNDPKEIEMAKMSIKDHNKVGGTVKYKCENGYIFIGGDLITCSSTGKWVGQSPGAGCSVSGSCSIDTDCSSVVISSVCINGLCVCPENYFFYSSYSVCAKDCKSIYDGGNTADGVYTISPDGVNNEYAYCDMTGGGWTVFQRRSLGDIPFNNSWNTYLSFFGNINGDYWLGLNNLHALTRASSEVYFDLTSSTGTPLFAHYQNFSVEDSSTNFRMIVSNEGVVASSSLTQLNQSGFYYHNGMAFSTYDVDNDMWPTGNCAVTRSAWWMNSCYVFGMFHQNNINYMVFGETLTSDFINVRKTIMKVRRIQ